MFQTSALSFPSENGAGAVQGWRRHRRVPGTSSEPQRVPGLLCQVSSPLRSALRFCITAHSKCKAFSNGLKMVCISCRTHREDNFLAVKHGNYTVDMDEIMGEALDWTMQYLQYMWVDGIILCCMIECPSTDVTQSKPSQLSLFGFLRHAASIFIFLINNASQTSVASLPSTLANATLWQISSRLLVWFSQSQS